VRGSSARGVEIGASVDVVANAPKALRCAV